MSARRLRFFGLALLVSSCLLRFSSGTPAAESLSARQILEVSGVQGGLIVHVGCGDGRLTAALHAGDGFLVQGLDRDAGRVDQARQHIRSKGLYGPVSADQLTSDRLPYVDDLVRLIVIQDAGCKIQDAELLRALCPGGVLCDLRSSPREPRVVRKPWSKDLDEWTHDLHGPDNNAVSHDRTVDVLQRLQWVGGPRFGRHHDHISSVSACVTAQGRVFYIVDEGLRASIYLPPQWQLVARDAFSGVVLWKRPISQWASHLIALKSGPAGLPKRLVAVGDRVYVTLGIQAGVSELDAATGKTLREYPDSAGTEQLVCKDGVLYLVAGQAKEGQAKADKQIMAVNADDGQVLWRHSEPDVATNTLAVGDASVFYFDGRRVCALAANSGKPRWQTEKALPSFKQKTAGFFAPTLVVAGDTVLFSGGEKYVSAPDLGSDGTMTALDAATGRQLWRAPHPPSGYRSPEDLLVINNLVWCGNTTHHGVGSPWEKTVNGKRGGSTGVFTGRDLHTGEVAQTINPPEGFFWFHHRCYPGKATERFLLMSRTGIEFIDVAEGNWTMHHWARGACLYGIMPANGMVYAPQHPCACYLMAKISGFCAMAPGSKSLEPPLAEADRLQHGPAYGVRGQGSGVGGQDAIGSRQYAVGSARQASAKSRNPQIPKSPAPNPQSPIPNPSSDWPMYRRDAQRSGFSPRPVATDLVDCWRQKLPGPVTAPIVAEDRLFAAVPSQHAVYALIAAAGKLLWQFTAGGPVDSPPTYARGRIVFGSSDGCVYCLDATTGGLLWRYRAAPTERRHMSFEQLESTHPVSGSVLVQDNKVYAVSGRYRFLDGGLRFLILDLATGNKLAETVLDATDSQTGKPFQLNHDLLNMPTATPDILVSDGRAIYMKDQQFALDGRPRKTVVPDVLESEEGPRHLLCPTGLLDDSFWHRSYWVYGTTFYSGYGGYFVAGQRVPAGRILVFNGDTVFGYGRRATMYKWSSPMEYTLFAARKDAPTASARDSGAAVTNAKAAKKPGGGMQKFERLWEYEIPLQVRALTLAGNRLLVLGVKDVLDETKARNDPEGWARQEEYMTGRHGSILSVVDAATGQTLAERPLDQFPTFDGMACAYGRVYVTGADGTVQCLGAKTN